MGVIPGLHAPPLPTPPAPQGLEEVEATLAESEGVGPRAVILCFRDYTTLLWMRVQPSPAQPPTCSLGLVPEPQTPASLSTRLSQTPVGPRGFMLVQKGNFSAWNCSARSSPKMDTRLSSEAIPSYPLTPQVAAWRHRQLGPG